MSQLVHHEAELAVVVGARLKHATPAEVRAGLAGFTCLNDVTARDLQRKDVQFTRAKGFDTFAPVGPWLVTELDPSDLAIRCRVNGASRQEGRTSDMVWDVFTVVSFISRVMTLLPGDIVTTGTPPGVGPLVAGDRVEVEIEGIGVLANTCVAAP
jgi:2-keto-4-pentenoate hydratase/2-oxohepta-3-ene-1,7-dioic acid hydratase in catechol pathway